MCLATRAIYRETMSHRFFNSFTANVPLFGQSRKCDLSENCEGIFVLIRIGEDLYEIDDSLSDHFFGLDIFVDRALSSGDDVAFQRAILDLIEATHLHGRAMQAVSKLPVDIVVPNPETRLEQMRMQMDSEALED